MFLQGIEEFLGRDRAVLEEARDHRQIRQHRRVHQRGFVQREAIQPQLHVFVGSFFDGRWRGWIGRRWCRRWGEAVTRRRRLRRSCLHVCGRRFRRSGHGRHLTFGLAGCRTAFPVEQLLVPPALFRLIMLLAPCVGQFAAMVLAATEFAAKIFPIYIPRMREEANPTTAAVDRAACQTGMIAQDPIQRHLILTNKRKGAIVLMPIPAIPAKFKNFAESYDKNARFLVRILNDFCISPSYPLDANASRGRAGIFLWICINDR